MSISKIDPTLTIEKLTIMTENQFFDRKSARLSPKDLAHHLSAFSNASGGLVVLGIENDGAITGVSELQENAFRQSAFDFLQIIPDYTIEEVPCFLDNGECGKVLLFHISPNSNEIVKLKNGEAYLRSGDSSRKLSADQLMALEYSKGIKSYESRVVEDASLTDLDEELIQKYVTILNPSVSSPLDVLKRFLNILLSPGWKGWLML